jgi:hypothetical protein
VALDEPSGGLPFSDRFSEIQDGVADTGERCESLYSVQAHPGAGQKRLEVGVVCAPRPPPDPQRAPRVFPNPAGGIA